MKSLQSIFALCVVLLLVASCKKNDGQLSTKTKDRIAFDSTQVATFLSSHPEFKSFEPQFGELYKKHQYQYIWYDKDGRVDFAEV